MIETPVYTGKETIFYDFYVYLERKGIEVYLLQSKPIKNTKDDVREEYVYLVDSVAMKVRVTAPQLPESLTGDIYINLIGKEQEKVSEIEDIVGLFFNEI